MRKLFISYNSADRLLLEEFEMHLQPWMKGGQLEVWRERPGDSWHDRIRQNIEGADGAVVLVSPNLFGSDYIDTHEIPALMEAAEAGRLVLMPLFLRDSNADVRTYDILDAKTGKKGIQLTKYEGLNKRSEPVDVHDKAERDRRLASCASKLWAALEQRPDPDVRRRQTRATLTVKLERRTGEVVAFYVDDSHAIHSHQHLIDARLQSWPDTHLSEEQLGDALWSTLFHDEWRLVLNRILHKEVQSPIQFPLRVRLRTSDQKLRSLPWSLTRWREYFLSSLDWTFELAAGDSPDPVVRLETPCEAMMIASLDTDGLDLKTQAHYLAFSGMLDNIWQQPGRVEAATLVTDSREAVEMLQRGPVPRLVYVYCSTVERTDQVVLRFAREGGGFSTLPFADLARAWHAHPPKVVFLNTIGRSPVAPEADVPLLIHRRENDPELARRHAQLWWREVLAHGSEPVRALYSLGAGAWGTTVIQTRFETFEVKVRDQTPKTDRPRAFLDRRLQRDTVSGAIKELAKSRLVLCLIVFGERGNLVAHFPTQMIATLRESESDRVRVHHMPLRFRRSRSEWSEAQIDADFREHAGLQPAEGLEVALARVRMGGARAAPLFFLDWGVYGPGDGKEPPLRRTHLQTWLRFCRDRLDKACAGHARVIAYVGIETAQEKFATLREWAETVRADLSAPHFDFILPDPLGVVKVVDLTHFLVDEANSSCPREYIRELPERIVLETGGNFEKTVTLLEDAEARHAWPELMHTLPKVAPRDRKPQDEDDTEL